MSKHLFKIVTEDGGFKTPVALRRSTRTPTLVPPTSVPTTPNIFDPDPEEETPATSSSHFSDSLAIAIRDKDALFIRGLGLVRENARHLSDFSDILSIKQAIGSTIFQFMHAVYHDDLDRVAELWFTSRRTIEPRLHTAEFFFFEGSGDVCFVTPAHLVRSFEMAHFLKTRTSARFDIPDSDGRLPQSYWAVIAQSARLFPYAERYLNMDMRNAGRQAGITSFEPFSPPIWDAVTAGNDKAIEGLGKCETAGINDQLITEAESMTPFMTAAKLASETAFGRDTTPMHDLGCMKPAFVRNGANMQARLRGLWAFAKTPHVDWGSRDPQGWTVWDYAQHPSVARLLKRACAHT